MAKFWEKNWEISEMMEKKVQKMRKFRKIV